MELTTDSFDNSANAECADTIGSKKQIAGK